MKFIITAGGQGTKLWPLSRDNYPKQFNKILGDKTLFQLNVEALLTKYPATDIFVSVSEKYVDYVRTQAPMIPLENYIVEPHIKKATGPSVIYSMLHMDIKYPDEVIMYYVQPVVLRTPVDKYIEMIEGIEKIVKQYGKFVTGAKYPLYPEIGSDYQQLGNIVPTQTSLEVYDAIDFVSRPKTIEEATNMLSSMKLTLHCNHSTWTTKEFFKELEVYKKDWFDVSVELRNLILEKASMDKILSVYSKFSAGNIEIFTRNLYSAGKAQVVILPFEWRHITTWEDIYQYQKDSNLPLIQGLNVFTDSSNNLIINKTNKLIAGLDVKDMLIIQTEDATLICPRNDSGKISDLLSKLEYVGLSQYL